MRSPPIRAALAKWTEHLEVILKLAERCNINCTYCYVFNGADKSFERHPPSISNDTVKNVALFLRDACLTLKISALQIDFHGGEPLLVGKRRFDKICGILRDFLDPVTRFQLAIQTNAILIDKDWISLFSNHRVSPGVSLDGPKDINDVFRLDFKRRSSYSDVQRGLSLLRNAFKEGLIDSLGILAVINPLFPAKRIYNHFVHELEIHTLDFLFPDLTHDSFLGTDDGTVGQFLCDVFDTWNEEDDPNVFVRVLTSVLALLLGGRSRMIGFGGELPAAISITTDGTLGPDDTLRGCGEAFFCCDSNVRTTSLVDFLAQPVMLEVFDAGRTIPRVCKNCCWELICRGGHLIHRFSTTERFRRESVFCNSLKRLYSHIGNYLIEEGELTLDKLAGNLRLPGWQTQSLQQLD